jgi:hydrogenase maturation protein HypF
VQLATRKSRREKSSSSLALKTWHIHIEGLVQGVGFRPFVYQLAQKWDVKGWVNNTTDGVHIELIATPEKAHQFLNVVLKESPSIARITQSSIKEIEEKFFDNFQIIHSDDNGPSRLLLTPDFAICKDCKTELLQVENRRYQYAFITCTNCGPRYSIVESLPYDRPYTTMSSFPMCPTCEEEYHDPSDRRYFSQTNSCSDCGIQMQLYSADGQLLPVEQGQIIDQVIQAWNKGQIVAIKGIGGYLITCDATNEETIQELRLRKHRPSKPFALMYGDIDDVNSNYHCSIASKTALESIEAPIVLLEKDSKTNPLAWNAIAPKLDKIGIMLAYTPLYVSLLEAFAKPIVATSGNISSAPIVYEDDLALSTLGQIADLILVNNRKIVQPQDDSVWQFSPQFQQKIILRRSRGFAPTYVNPSLALEKESVLAMGAMLKSTFTQLHQGNIYISQYLGDLGQYQTQQSFQSTLQHFQQLMRSEPEVILLDLHKDYPSTILGQQLAEEFQIPTFSVQHHEAHFGAVLGEHSLLHSAEPILGVVWDGTGLGMDQNIWGGEFFVYRNHSMQRVAHLQYFDCILQDKMAKEPRISALAACFPLREIHLLLASKFSKIEWRIYQKKLSQSVHLKTSSMGRIFDAVASLLGIADFQSYEGEAAMLLEQLGRTYVETNGMAFSESYTFCFINEKIETQLFFQELFEDLNTGKALDWIAAKFHYSLVLMIKNVANNLKINKIAFSGGVFQNSLLVDFLIYEMKQSHRLYFHQELSPNDENISFGQLICYQVSQLKNHKN